MISGGEGVNTYPFTGASYFFESYESIIGFDDAFRAVKYKRVTDPQERKQYREEMCDSGDQYSCGVLFALGFLGVNKPQRKPSSVLDAGAPQRAREVIERK